MIPASKTTTHPVGASTSEHGTPRERASARDTWLTRRFSLRSAAASCALVLALGAQACAPITAAPPTTSASSTGSTATATTPTKEQAAAALVTGLTKLAPTLLTNTGLSQTAKNAVTDITSIASAGLAADVSNVGASLMTRIGNDASAVLSEVTADMSGGTLNLSSTEQQIVSAAQVILPIAETGLEIAAAVGVAPAPGSAPMDAAQAMRILRGQG